jgi:hypothetical protein
MALSEKAIQEYIERGGDHCPYCKSKNLSNGDGELLDGAAWQNVWCDDCGQEWTENYSLTAIDELEIPEIPKEDSCYG